MSRIAGVCVPKWTETTKSAALVSCEPQKRSCVKREQMQVLLGKSPLATRQAQMQIGAPTYESDFRFAKFLWRSLLLTVLALSFEVILLQLAVQGGFADAENARCGKLVAAGFAEGAQNGATLQLFEG